jgi:hypothetical protein
MDWNNKGEKIIALYKMCPANVYTHSIGAVKRLGTKNTESFCCGKNFN